MRTQRGSQTCKNPYGSQKSRAKLKKHLADTFFFSGRESDFLDLLKYLPKFLHEVINWVSFFFSFTLHGNPFSYKIGVLSICKRTAVSVLRSQSIALNAAFPRDSACTVRL